jgi:cytochrome c oxidase cbb3-type subunit IV
MLSGIVTLILLLAFIAGTAWAYSRNRQDEFSQAEKIPLENNEEIMP